MATPARVFHKPAWRGRAGVRVAAVAALLVPLLAGCETVFEEESELSVAPIIAPAAPETLVLAQRALAEQRYGDANKLRERVLIADPQNLEARLLGAELSLATGAPKQAAEIFESLIASPEVAAPALQGHGISLMLLGARNRGVESLRQAVELDPTLWRAWNALGYYYDYERDWAAAAESYSRALEGNPNSAFIFNNRGFSMLMQKRLDEAIEDLNLALKIEPDFEVAQENLRLALAWSGRYIHAMSGTADRDMARVLNNIGFIAVLRGDYKNAEAYLLRAMEVDPSYNDVASRNLKYLEQVRELDKAGSQTTAY